MRCNICEYEWTTSASSIVSGHGCPRCANNGIYSQEEFVHKLSTINPHIEILSGYERSNKPVKCMCTICGHIWDSSPNNLLRGTGCPACYHSTTSFIEQVVFEVFKLIVGKDAVLSRDRTAIGKELDVYVPSLNIAIEPGSWRWHKDKLENDQSKRSLCAEKGIRLITIYSDYDGDTPPFASDCICVKETLGFEGDHQSLKLLITDLLKLVNIELVISSYQWRSILSKAYVHSKRMTTLEFKNKVSKIHANIEVTGDYTGAWNRIECECKVCARKWSPAANSLLQGHGCPTCASKKRGLENRKSHDQFVAELKISNPKIEVISPYILSTEKITCLCSVCKNEWSALPGSLLEGKGCPKCAQEKRKKKG